MESSPLSQPLENECRGRSEHSSVGTTHGLRVPLNHCSGAHAHGEPTALAVAASAK